MKSGYVAINNYTRKGEIGISRQCLEQIVKRAVNGVPGAKLSKRSSRWLFDWDKILDVTIHKNGSVEVSIDVAVKSAVDVQSICLKIQQEVTSAISLMCETVPLQVSIRVVEIQ